MTNTSERGDLALNDAFEPQFGDSNNAIQVLGLHKRYRKYRRSKIVLNGLNLNCPTGKLYILYGTGNSGKSAVVKSILRIESFSRGAIAVFNKNVKHSYNIIGYMPQKVGLDASLTAIETINYFAELQKLDKHECVKNFSAMQSPITVTEFSILIGNLNEDQRRVLSFYIAIMGSPKLVILDQPVAACDPLYKNFIWNKLRSMVENETTSVFMTCSDEIDVKYADIVGYLRNGQIIVEESPSDLMKRYNIWSFNDLILSISVAELKQFRDVEPKKAQAKDNVSIKSGGFAVTHFTSNDDADSMPNEKIIFDGSFCDSYDDKSFFESCKSINLKDIFKQLGILIKWQTIISVRRYLRVILHFILPTLCILFYGYSVGNDMTEVNVAIVYCGNESIQCANMSICDFGQKISEKYLNKKYYKTYDDATNAAETEDLSAILLLNKEPGVYGAQTEFGCQTKAFATSNIVLEIRHSSKLVRSHIIDQLSRAYGGDDGHPMIAVRTVSYSTMYNKQECLTDCPVTPFISTFKYKTVGIYESEVTHLIWGSVATISHFSGAILGALPLCVLNRNGLIDRMKMMEIKHYKVLLVHWATRTVFVIVQNLLLFVSAITFLQLEYSAYRFFSGWLAIILQTLCGFSFGILLYATLKKQVSIILSLVILELVVSSLSGFLWNYHGLSHVFQKLTIVLPHYSVSKLLFKVVVNDFSLSSNNLWVGFVSPLFWMISTLVIYYVYTSSNK